MNAVSAITLEHATAMVRAHVASSEADLVVVEAATRTYPWGWVFFYDSRQHLASGEPEDSLLGNAPLLVERESRRLLTLGTAHPVEHYVENYEATGNPHTEPGRTVALLGGSKGANQTSATVAVRDNTNLGLSDAKAVIEGCTKSAVHHAVARDMESAARLVAVLAVNGFRARVVADAQVNENSHQAAVSGLPPTD
jgi:hypothetical protein